MIRTICKIRKVLADARAIDSTPLHIDFLVVANVATWGTVLAFMVGGLLA